MIVYRLKWCTSFSFFWPGAGCFRDSYRLYPFTRMFIAMMVNIVTAEMGCANSKNHVRPCQNKMRAATKNASVTP